MSIMQGENWRFGKFKATGLARFGVWLCFGWCAMSGVALAKGSAELAAISGSARTQTVQVSAKGSNERSAVLYDPTALSQVALAAGDAEAHASGASLPIVAVVVGADKQEFLMGKRWYKVGDIVLESWVVDEINSDRLILRSKENRDNVWVVELDASSDQVIKSYRKGGCQ